MLHTQSKEYIVNDIIEFRKEQIPLEAALDFFYTSFLYQLVSEGCSDMH